MTSEVQNGRKSRIFFRGILQAPRGSVILVTVENMPIAPTGALTVATNCPYSHLAEPQEGGAGVGQSIYIGQQYDAATQLSYLNARYYEGSQGQFISQDPVFLAMGNPGRVSQLASVFIQSDLSKLIQIIHESRPDLTDLGVPDYWLGSKW